MNNIGKPNFYGNYAGVNAGVDIDFDVLPPQGGNYNWFYGSSSQHVDHNQLDQTDVTKPSGNQPAGRSSGELQHQTIKEYSLSPGSIMNESINSKTNAAPAPAPAPEKAAKKRQIDKDYRERCKRNKMQMEMDLKCLDEENKQLKMENQSLKEKSSTTAEMLQSQARELYEQKIVLDRLKYENEKQNALVQTLSELVVNNNLNQEYQKLKDENDSLRKIVELGDRPLKLAEDNVKLQRDNMSLKVQIDALCGKIILDNKRQEILIEQFNKHR